MRAASAEHLRPWEPIPASGWDATGRFFFENDLARAREADTERLVVCEGATGSIAGRVAINQIFRGPFESCVLGYWMGASFAGRGLMTEAIGLTLRHAFGRLRLHRVEANIMPSNEASRRVVMRNGLRCEGVALRFLQIAGEWRDHERWAITREEWAGGA